MMAHASRGNNTDEDEDGVSILKCEVVANITTSSP